MNVLFVCVGNACRSQIAKAWFNALAKNARAESAGTKPAERVSSKAVEVMREVGIDISKEKPKKLTEEMVRQADLIVTMGCEVECPFLPKEKTITWNVEDPLGKGIEKYREVRDRIRELVEKLIAELNV
jgi:arsenate reductase